MQFVDAVDIAGTRLRDDGYLVADARVARTGIQTYAGWEVGKPDQPIIRVYRPDVEVFARDAMASFAHRPVTNDHPDQPVTADNWKEVAVGHTADEVARDGVMLRVPLMIADAAAIKDIQGGKRELSAGYTCDLSFEDGVTPEGEAYDAIQRNIRANHVAIVQRGRAGSQARIGDAGNWGPAPITTTIQKESRTMSDALRTVVVDGLSVQTTDQGAQAIARLQKDLENSAAKISQLTADHADAIKAKDQELAKKDAELDDLKGKVLDAKALDALVQARSDLIAKAKLIAADVKTDGLSDAEIRKAAVVAKIGDAAIKDKPEAYIDARFDILAEDAEAKAKADPVRTAMQSQDRTHQHNDNGQAAYEQRLADAWKIKKEA